MPAKATTGAAEQLVLPVTAIRRESPAAHPQPSDGISDLAAGTAAEHLVCADLLLAGYLAFLADQNCPYDIAVDLGDARLVRLQVKSTRGTRRIPFEGELRAPVYSWSVRRARGGLRPYKPGEFDVLALVALDVRLIAYLAPSQHRQTINIKPLGTTGGKQFSHYPFERAVAEVQAA